MQRKLLIATTVLILLFTSIAYSYKVQLTKSVVPNNITVEIENGDSLAKITSKLLERGLSIDNFWFKVIAYQKGVSKNLKVGEYELTTGLTAPQILAILSEGRAKKYTITFPEGWSLKEILHAITKHPSLKKTLPADATKEITQQLGIMDKNPEGWFFPDTYNFVKNDTDISVLKRAYAKMQAVLEEEWQHKADNLPYQKSYDALIMASIVEKETGAKHERTMIAGVFTRRLVKGMLLQTDPTVIYGMGDSYRGNIRAKDLTAATPYNTYVISGLPPTPIAMPGRDAIHAALHPDKEENLYFVAKGDGSHQFSVSLADHNHAVNNFQKHLK